MKSRMEELERQKADLTARLAEAPGEGPDILPNVSGVYRKKIQRLTVALNNPKDRAEAESWLHWLTLHHYTVSIGLMQVNAELAPKLHVKPEQLLEPCTNLRVGAAILISMYTGLAREIGEGFSALESI